MEDTTNNMHRYTDVLYNNQFQIVIGDAPIAIFLLQFVDLDGKVYHGFYNEEKNRFCKKSGRVINKVDKWRYV